MLQINQLKLETYKFKFILDSGRSDEAIILVLQSTKMCVFFLFSSLYINDNYQ